MNKGTLQKFIEKYNLSGTAEAVLYTAEAGKGISTRFMTEDNHIIGEIANSELTLPDGTYSVYDTAQLKSLLSTLGDAVTVTVNQKNNKNMSLTLKDDTVKVNFVLGDPSSIPAVPLLKKVPTFDIVGVLDRPFIDRYLKAIAALKDIETFAITSDGTDTQVCVGFSKNNTNQVAINLQTTTAVKFDAVHFHAKYFRELMAANKDADSGTIEVASTGLLRVTFTVPNFTITYYLPQMIVQN